MTKYLQSDPFSVKMGGTKEYSDNWDAIFMCKSETSLSDVESGTYRCCLKRGHDGPHMHEDLTWT